MVRTETTRWRRSRLTITAIDAAASVALTALNTISLPRLIPRNSLMITEANAAMDRTSVTPIRYLLTPEVHIAKANSNPSRTTMSGRTPLRSNGATIRMPKTPASTTVYSFCPRRSQFGISAEPT
jgi:hypothetical protein